MQNCVRLRLWFSNVGVALLCVLCGASTQAAPPSVDVHPAAESQPAKSTRTIGIVLYPMFELLDVYGPAEVFGNVTKGLKVVMVGKRPGPSPRRKVHRFWLSSDSTIVPRLTWFWCPAGWEPWQKSKTRRCWIGCAYGLKMPRS